MSEVFLTAEIEIRMRHLKNNNLALIAAKT